MRSRSTPTTVVAAFLLIALAQSGGRAQPPATEEFARGQFRLALEFMRKGRPSEALADLQRIVDAYPESSVADDALLEIATYHLEVAHDVEMAQKTVTLLLQKYPATEVTPSAYVLAGRIGMMGSSAPTQIDAVLANFERAGMVPRLDVTPVASFYAGQALRIGARHPEAIERFMRVAVEYPRSPWAARSLLGLARSWVALQSPRRAMAALQQVRDRFPGTPEASSALAWNTVLYRLYLRGSATAALKATDQGYAGPAGKLDDVQALTPSQGQRALVVTSRATYEFGADDKKTGRIMTVNDARGAFFMPDGRPIIVTKQALVSPETGAVSLAVTRPDGSPRRLDNLRAGVATEIGTVLVADDDERAILHFTSTGKALGEFAAVRASRLVVSDLGEVAALDRDSKSVVRFDRSGRPIGRIQTKGAGYELRNPVDLAVDQLGHLYLLDRETASVHVFAPRGPLVSTFTLAEKESGAVPRATSLAVDDTGQLFVYDDRTKRVQVYR